MQRDTKAIPSGPLPAVVTIGTAGAASCAAHKWH